jgi:putative tricarboxylic transport membrane protein
MRVTDLVVVLLLLAFGVGVVVQAQSVGPGWARGRPESGFFPYWLGVILIVLCLIVAAQLLWRWRRLTEPFFHDRRALGSVLKVVGTAGVALALIYFVGFYAAAVLYMLLYTRWVGRHRWSTALAVSLGIPIAIYVVFERWLLILLPRGLWDLFDVVVGRL